MRPLTLLLILGDPTRAFVGRFRFSLGDLCSELPFLLCLFCSGEERVAILYEPFVRRSENHRHVVCLCSVIVAGSLHVRVIGRRGPVGPVRGHRSPHDGVSVERTARGAIGRGHEKQERPSRPSHQHPRIRSKIAAHSW